MRAAAALLLVLWGRGGPGAALDTAEELKKLQLIAQAREADAAATDLPLTEKHAPQATKPQPGFSYGTAGSGFESETAARGSIATPQPGTPPTRAQLETLVRAARQRQRYLCGLWPAADNVDCQLLRGNARRPSFVQHNGSDAALERQLAWKLVIRDEAFNFRVMGSSSSAAHGAWFDASYAVTTAAAVRPVFAEVDVEFASMNQAMGSVDYRRGPLLCVAEIAGTDTDLATWEWGMFGPEPCTLEQWLRTVAALPRRPGMMFVQTSGPSSGGNFWGLYYYSSCKSANAKPEAKALCPEMMNKALHLPSGCADTAAGLSSCRGPRVEQKDRPCMTGGGPWDRFSWDNFLRRHDCVTKYAAKVNASPDTDPMWAKAARLYYAGKEPPSGLPGLATATDPNAWAPLSHPLQEHYAGQGISAHTMRAGSAANVDWKPWWISRMALLRSSHHPGSLGHVYNAHIIAHWLLDRVAAAAELALTEAARVDGGLPELAAVYRKMREHHRKKPLPPPRMCSKPGMEVIGGAGRHACFTDFLPRAAKDSDIRSHVELNEDWSASLPPEEVAEDAPRAYRDHKIFWATSKAGAKLRIALGKAPKGSPTGKVDVVACGVGAIADCGGKKVCQVSGGTGCGNESFPTVPARPFTLQWHGAGQDQGVPGAKGKLSPGHPKGFNIPVRRSGPHDCWVVCEVRPGDAVTLALTAPSVMARGNVVRYSHFLLVGSDPVVTDAPTPAPTPRPTPPPRTPPPPR